MSNIQPIPSENLKDMRELKRPEVTDVHLIDLGDGGPTILKAGPMSFDVMCEIEEKHGDLESFIASIVNSNKVSSVRDMLWMLAVNQDDFKDIKDMAKRLPVKHETMQEIRSHIMDVVIKSMPSEQVKSGGGETNEVKQSALAGQNQ